MNERLSGKVMPAIHESENAVELLEKIELFDITNDEKDLLFIASQLVGSSEKKYLVNTLKRIHDTGIIYPNICKTELLDNKMKNLEKLSEEELEKFSMNLINLIESDKITL